MLSGAFVLAGCPRCRRVHGQGTPGRVCKGFDGPLNEQECNSSANHIRQLTLSAVELLVDVFQADHFGIKSRMLGKHTQIHINSRSSSHSSCPRSHLTAAGRQHRQQGCRVTHQQQRTPSAWSMHSRQDHAVSVWVRAIVCTKIPLLMHAAQGHPACCAPHDTHMWPRCRPQAE